MTGFKSKKKNNKGFTLMETLVAVAILTALFALATVSVVAVQRNMRQLELDSKAETIYAAVQYRLAQLRAAGNASCYGVDANGGYAEGVRPLGYIPLDADDNNLNAGTLCYFVNDGAYRDAAQSIFPASCVDGSLWENQWLVEYNPDNGSVYGVFYCEDGDYHLSEATKIETDHSTQLDKMRTREDRLNQGAKVGYYGGDVTLVGSTDKLTPWINLQNGEELTADFYCKVPNTSVEDLKFTITFKDTDGNSSPSFEFSGNDLKREGQSTYSYKMVLDSLKPSENGQTQHFEDVLGDYLTPGRDFYIIFTASCSNSDIDDRTVGKHKEYMQNSLFAYSKTLPDDTAAIGCGRHLQNLNIETSNVHHSIKKAVQVSDISFYQDAPIQPSWYEVYSDMPFTPITNGKLSSFTAEKDLAIYGLHISDQESKAAGLFRTFSGQISNVTLTGVRIDGGDCVGALVGKLDGAATNQLSITNCRTYLSQKHEKEFLLAVESIDQISSWIKGRVVGGLVGYCGSTLTIEKSFAAVIAGTTGQTAYAGGLIGQTKSAVLTISTSYADCYLFGNTTGGLIGFDENSRSIDLTDFYAVGYQKAEETAAGIVVGSPTKAKNGYAAVAFNQPSGSVYSTFISAQDTPKNVFYLKDWSRADVDAAYTTAKNYSELREAYGELGAAFVAGNTGVTYAYNLLGQGLSDYSYPRLVEMLHCGDWQAEFENGALVYYEVYKRDEVEDEDKYEYGFFGGNVSTLKSDSVAVGDGYALVYSRVPHDKTVYLNGVDKQIESYIQIEEKGNTYYLVPIEIAKSGDKFYQLLIVKEDDGFNERHYWFNPDFAKTVVTTNSIDAPETPDVIYIRTARHLYNMSQHWEQYEQSTAGRLFLQELDLKYGEYEWEKFALTDEKITEQRPIQLFNGRYNGQNHKICGLSICAATQQIGLFGKIEGSGIVENVVLDGENCVVQFDGNAIGSKNSASLGVLAGENHGIIRNCAVSGYQIVYTAYSNNVGIIGGLVGTNMGIISNSTAEVANVLVRSTKASIYAAGFVGSNQGAIFNAYSVGAIKVEEASQSTVSIAGFVANNNGGVVRNCYTATALTVAGDAVSQGFGFLGGSYSQCYYLNGEAFDYRDNLYIYNFVDNKVGIPVTSDELKNLQLPGFKIQAEENGYPYPRIFQNAQEYVHYEKYPERHNMGTLGIFYWEYEQGSSNSGYHFSYVGTQEGKQISGSSLCSAHDDGGVITSFGYGYFYKENEGKPTLTAVNCNFGNENTEAAAAMASQLAGYKFVAYETGETSEKMRLNGVEKNSTWTLTSVTGESYVYSVCPFFADAISLDSILGSQTGTAKPGAEGNAYQIRSVKQLQFINWNNKKENTSSYIVQTQGTSTANVIFDRFTYLSYGRPGTDPSPNLDLFWEQSHDLNATQEGFGNFTPIGSMYDDAGNSGTANAVMAFFSSSFDGQAYAIKNVRIETAAQCVGLFGVTAGAKMKNIVMYSDDGAQIIHNDSKSWYSVGGLVGLAGDRNQKDSSFTNCTVSGYTIRDNQGTEPGWGGGCVGGLVGATTMDLTNCSAVSSIEINISYNNGYKNLRVGGLVGCCRGSIQNCYAGGKIENLSKITHSHYSDSANIWMGGILGGIVLRNGGNLATLIGDTTVATTVKNCYCFVEMSTNGKNGVKSIQSIASNGEMQEQWNFQDVINDYIVIENCYVLEACAVNCDDYNVIKNASNYNLLNINTTSGKYERRIELVNSRSPYMSYEEMSNGTLGAMLGDFSTVTTTENGANVNGKYSFPGTDQVLQGLNYPFPTILTQVNAFNETVNVHYGAWPYAKMYWARTSANLDLLIEEGTAVTYLYGESGSLSFIIKDEDGNIIADESLAVSARLDREENGYQVYEVTIKGTAVGHYTVQAQNNGRSAELDVSVSSSMLVTANSSDVKVDYGIKSEFVFTVTDKNGDPIADLQPNLTLILPDSLKDIVVFDNQKINYDQATGQLKVPVTVYAAGETTVTITFRYAYDKAATVDQLVSLLVVCTEKKDS